jgi:purine-nucleoside phosphorylase
MMDPIPTPHIEAADADQIADTIFLPGDPLRAKFIAETYLSEVSQFNAVRNMLGYTGSFQGKRVSVMGTGMGMPSIGIYSYELIHFYGVKNLIRVGSCGAMQPDLQLKDIILAMSSSTLSGFGRQYNLPGDYAPTASWSLLKKAVDAAGQKGLPVRVGSVLSTDVFYQADEDVWKQWARMGVLAVEMETSALYMNAAAGGVDALSVLSVSDSLVSRASLSAKERQVAFTRMFELALSLA